MPFSARFRRRLSAGAIAAVALLVHTAPAQAQGDLLVAPTRVIISGGGTAEVILNNIGDRPATYRVGLELRRMSPVGELEDVAESDANAAEAAALAMIRYAPRRITLPPNQPQSIRISARPGPELADGEYRVHMSFRAIPDPISPEEAAKEQTATGLSIKLTPIYGVTIPVIIRKGQLTATAAIANPRVISDGGAKYFTLDMSRSGGRSVYGELVVRPAGGGEPIFMARGIAVYPELEKRQLHWPISAEQAAKLRGPLHFEYREMPENGGKLIAALDGQVG